MTLEVLTSDPVALFITFVNESGEVGEPQLLARVEGRDTVKFVVPDMEFSISHINSEAHVAMYTGDGTFHHRVDMGEEKFTQIYEGRKLSPELQDMYDKLNRNFMRNQRQMMEELDRVAAERDRLEGLATAGVRAQEQAPVAVPPSGEASGTGATVDGSGEDGDESTGS